MHQELSIALLTGLGGMLGWGFADFFAKKTIDQIGSVASLVWAHVFGAIFFAILVWIKILILNQPINIPTTATSWAGLIFFGALQAIVYLLVYIGFSKGKLALLNPIFASYSGLAAILSILFLGEVLKGNLVLALAVIFGGILLLNIDPLALKEKRLNITSMPGVKEMLFASALAAFWTVGWSKFVGGNDWLIYALFMYVFMTITSLIIARWQKVNLLVKNSKLFKFLIFIGVGEVVAYAAISLGFSTTSHTSIIALLSGSFSLPTLILSHYFLKEKITILQRLAGIVIILGIMILSIHPL